MKNICLLFFVLMQVEAEENYINYVKSTSAFVQP